MNEPNSDPSDNSVETSEPHGETKNADSKITELEAKLKEQENKYLYLYADFENHRKRAVKERSETIKFGWENVARDLLGVLDNFERAVGHLPPGTDPSFADGLKMIADQFQTALSKQGVAPVSIQQAFDPMIHEAVGQEDSDKPAGTIIQELDRGYTLHGRLLRPARVIVSSGKTPTVN